MNSFYNMLEEAIAHQSINKLDTFNVIPKPDQEETEETLKAHAEAVNAFVLRVCTITAGANTIVVTHHITLGQALLKLKEQVHAAKLNWGDWASENIKLRPRTREKAMFLASCEIAQTYYVAGKERLYDFCKLMKKQNKQGQTDEILASLAGDLDLEDVSDIETFKEALDSWGNPQEPAEKNNANIKAEENSESSEAKRPSAASYIGSEFLSGICWDGNSSEPTEPEKEQNTPQVDETIIEREFLRMVNGIAGIINKFTTKKTSLKSIKVEAINNLIEQLETIKGLIAE